MKGQVSASLSHISLILYQLGTESNAKGQVLTAL